MKTTIRISAIAPTGYQLVSLRHFGMEVSTNINGFYSASQEFETEKEAKEYLVTRATRYFDGNADNDEAKLQEALSDIEQYGMLRLDAVQANIEEVELEDDKN